MIKIDDNVPIATRRNQSRYPFRDLQPGQSFFVAGKTTAAMAGSLSNARRIHAAKFASRNVTENGVTGVRIWRVL